MAEHSVTAAALTARHQTAGSAASVRRLPGFGWSVGLIVPIMVLLLWQLAAGGAWIEADLLPSPATIAQTFWAMVQDGSLANDILVTVYRLALGFVLGTAAGTVAGLLTGALPLARRLLDPTLQALRSVPSLAWVPLFILWFGIYDTSKVILIAVGVFFPVYLNLMAAIAGVDRKLIEVGRVHDYGKLRLMLRIQLPAAMPLYLTGIRGGLGLGWMFIASAEMMGANNGLGFILTNGEEIGRPDQIIVAILAFAVLGKSTDWLLARTAERLTDWQDKLHPETGA
ncbi:ABC transporter permease [Acidisoma cellulosilytica]|uniref:ABC transporter permease n=1 Tax=Acidisoma cellulosilyticum TaxID=2802395 RepID=A0A964E2Z8_9PROT|nr:ABC transporter permease [Acidisoma cellulosilyticum]MCB8879839.1 ABC transporter permease [Acidisoma cellulosilyticum]